MFEGKRIATVLPAYNAEKTLRQTYREIPREVVDDVLLVDDSSTDLTVSVARGLGIKTIVHHCNLGYGANQKSCYRAALEMGADIVIMIHPDYQYSPKLIPAMVSLIASGNYDIALGSRILGRGALANGMPLYKYISNRGLTFIQNILLAYHLSEYHTGYRAYARHVLETIPFEKNSNSFLFDNQLLAQAIYFHFRIGEISCPTRYFPEASTIDWWKSIVYGLGVLRTTIQLVLNRRGLVSSPIFIRNGQPPAADRSSRNRPDGNGKRRRRTRAKFSAPASEPVAQLQPDKMPPKGVLGVEIGQVADRDA